jgi:hypothetical protein
MRYDKDIAIMQHTCKGNSGDVEWNKQIVFSKLNLIKLVLV